MTAPLPVCSAKLSIVGPGQYYGGGPRWNPWCCSFTKISLLLVHLAVLELFLCDISIFSGKIKVAGKWEVMGSIPSAGIQVQAI